MGTKATTVIIAVWRRPLDLSGLRKGEGQRVLVVGPSGYFAGEHNVDLIYQIDGPVSRVDNNYTPLLQKVLELCASMPNARRRLITFERALQADVAQVRHDLGIDGMQPDLLKQLTNRRELRAACKRGGLACLRYCSLGSVQAHAEEWVAHARGTLGRYPMLLRPARAAGPGGMKVVRGSDEFGDFLREVLQKGRVDQRRPLALVAEECVEDGHELVALCTTGAGLLGTFSMMQEEKTFFTAVRDQVPYAIEFLSPAQTRDTFPGLETFVLQCLRTLFVKTPNTVVFIKAFYTGHNTITLMSASLELRRRTLSRLFAEAHAGRTWESVVVEAALEPSADDDSQPADGSANGLTTTATTTSVTNHASSLTTNHPPAFSCVVNFPQTEGILLHQISVPRLGSLRRAAWRVHENEEMLDAEDMDDNILQVFLSAADRDRLREDALHLMQRLDIPIDKYSAIDRSAVRWRRSRQEEGRFLSAGNVLVRSCTTAD